MGHNIVTEQCPHCGAWHHRFSIGSHMVRCVIVKAGLDAVRLSELSEPIRTPESVLEALYGR